MRWGYHFKAYKAYFGVPLSRDIRSESQNLCLFESTMGEPLNQDHDGLRALAEADRDAAKKSRTRDRFDRTHDRFDQICCLRES